MSESNSRCPQCGFTFDYDGIRCGHCGYGKKVGFLTRLSNWVAPEITEESTEIQDQTHRDASPKEKPQDEQTTGNHVEKGQSCNEQLWGAVIDEDMNQLRLLLEQGANVDAKTSEGMTPLCYAARFGAKDIVGLLLLHGADVTANGNAALMHASEKGYIDIVRLLIEKGADVNARSNYGNTPLYNAAWLGQTETVRFLIEKGADINAECDNGETPLVTAAGGGYINTVRLLLEKGGKEKVDRDTIISAMNAATFRGHHDIVKLLQTMDPTCTPQVEVVNLLDLIEAVGDEETLSKQDDKEEPRLPTSTVSNAQAEPQDINGPLAFAECNNCGECYWVKPDGTELVEEDFEDCGYIRYGVRLVCGSCGNNAILNTDTLLDVDLEGNVKRPKPQSIVVSSDLSFHASPWLSTLTTEDEIGILFDLSSLSSQYGEACWEIVFRSIRAEQIVGCSLLCGDVSIPVGDLSYSFCIALGISKIFRSDTQPMIEFVESLSKLNDVGLAPLEERFIYGSIRQSFPIIPCLTITPKSIVCTDDEMFGWILRLADKVGWAKLDRNPTQE